MTAQVTGLREIRRRLRELEDAVAAQRKTIASLEARGLDATDEREHLARLLSGLDALLADGGPVSRSGTRAKERAGDVLDPAEEASLQAVLRDCPL